MTSAHPDILLNLPPQNSTCARKPSSARTLPWNPPKELTALLLTPICSIRCGVRLAAPCPWTPPCSCPFRTCYLPVWPLNANSYSIAATETDITAILCLCIAGRVSHLRFALLLVCDVCNWRSVQLEILDTHANESRGSKSFIRVCLSVCLSAW